MIDRTIGDILDTTAGENPDMEALIYIERDLMLTYSEFL